MQIPRLDVDPLRTRSLLLVSLGTCGISKLSIVENEQITMGLGLIGFVDSQLDMMESEKSEDGKNK
jgi:hypothetical protein